MIMKVGDFEFNEKSWTVEIKATLSLQDGLSQSPTEDTSVRGITSRKRRGSIFKLLSSAYFCNPSKECGKLLMI